jgi:hypothetical protein
MWVCIVRVIDISIMIPVIKALGPLPDVMTMESLLDDYRTTDVLNVLSVVFPQIEIQDNVKERKRKWTAKLKHNMGLGSRRGEYVDPIVVHRF